MYCALAAYIIQVNHNFVKRAAVIERERMLSTDLGNGQCELHPTHKVAATEGAQRSLLVSFPGSGKRFTYTVIEGLTDSAPGDDWGFSGNDNALHIKSSYPHHEGTWSWGDKLDQTLFLIRNPRWALPSYHSMRFELDFASNWVESFSRVGFTYKERAPVESWESWRDEMFDMEFQNWVDMINFWMKGGKYPDGSTDPHCVSDLVCKPKIVIDFDTFFNEHPTIDFFRLGQVLDATPNVEVINAQARACILDAVWDTKNHNGGRDGNGPPANAKRFSAAQLLTMKNGIDNLITEYTTWKDNGDLVAEQLVHLLTEYKTHINAEYEFESDMV
jgi:hypothetical protein